MTLCIVCRNNNDGPVCEDDRTNMARLLARLPSRIEQVSMMVWPGQGGDDGPKVASAKKEPPLPLRAGAVSLLAGGSEAVTGMLHPLIRRWTTTSRKRVSRVVVVDGIAQIVEREEEITDYHREFVMQHDPASGRRCRCGRVHGSGWRPVEIPDDDQVGTLPPREWLDLQVRNWRRVLGDHVPQRTLGVITHRPQGGPVTAWPARWPQQSPVPQPTVKAARLSAQQTLALMSVPGGREVWSIVHAAAWLRQQQVNSRMGLVDQRDVEDRPLDPLQEDIESRFGEPPRSMAIAWDIKYLLGHLDAACDLGEEVGIAEFAAELEALDAEISRVLNVEDKKLWVGRCPAFLDDLDAAGQPTGRKKPCGAGLWQKSGWAQVPCPRCHSVWDTRGPAGRTLNREIRKIWPVDRRRRYSSEDLAALIPPRCPECRERVIIEWREVTGTEDLRERRRWWVPRSSRCDNGCEKARRIL
jgi:hypothetical protein